MIKEWREKQVERLRVKDEEEEAARANLKQQAAKVRGAEVIATFQMFSGTGGLVRPICRSAGKTQGYQQVPESLVSLPVHIYYITETRGKQRTRHLWQLPSSRWSLGQIPWSLWTVAE